MAIKILNDVEMKCTTDFADASMVDVFAGLSGLQEVVYRREGDDLVRRIRIAVPEANGVAAHIIEAANPLVKLPKIA